MHEDFYGLPTRILSNGCLRLEYLAQAGPRLVRLFLSGFEQNLFAEVPQLSWETAYGTYFLRGGHRLWHAPETHVRTSMPDNDGLLVEALGEAAVRLCAPLEAATGIRKSLEIRLHAGQPGLTLHHFLFNEGLWPVELAAWAITQLPLGGLVVLPQQVAALDPDGVLPNRHLVAWPYTCWGDRRLRLEAAHLFVDAQPAPEPFKVGYFNRQGWAGYLWKGIFFCKRFTPQPLRPHPDWGCNVEVFAKDLFVELETLGPLTTLQPGEALQHTEEWLISGSPAAPLTLEKVLALPLSSQPAHPSIDSKSGFSRSLSWPGEPPNARLSSNLDCSAAPTGSTG